MEQREQQQAEADQQRRGERSPAADAPDGRPSLFAQLQSNLREGIRQLQWGPIALFGISAGALMALSFTQSGLTAIIAGLIPVGTGLLLARRVRGFYALHGFITGLIAAAVSASTLAVIFLMTPLGIQLSEQAIQVGQLPPEATPETLFMQFASFSSISLIIFCAVGASMAGRTEQRNREARQAIEARGGQLDRAGTIRDADDIRGLSLPQLGWYVSNLFKKQGFTFKDYRFLDKDKHLDLWMEYQDEIWHLRLSVADKVSPGTVEGLAQELKREGYRKGVVITSTEFMPTALKSAKNRPIVLIDGVQLYEIAEK